MGGEEATERWSRPASHRGWKLPTEFAWVLRHFRWVPPGSGGRSSLSGLQSSSGSRALCLRVQGACSSLRVRAGRGFEAWSENTLEGKKPRRVTAADGGQLASVANGFVRGRTLRSRRSSRQAASSSFEPSSSGTLAFGSEERAGIVVRGRQADARKRASRQKRAVIRRGRRGVARGWITAGEPARLERDTRSLRGEHSEGGSQERLRHETRPRTSG